MGDIDKPIKSWITKWTWINTLILIYDGSFCILRPHSLPGGCLEKVWYSYRYYIKADTHYADVKDVFVWSQGLLNILEAAITLLVVLNIVKNIRLQKMVLLVSSTMTFWKTVLYVVYSMEIPRGGHKSDYFIRELLLVYVLGSVWIILPGLVAVTLSREFVCVSGSTKTVYHVQTEDREEESESDEVDASPNAVSNTKKRYNLRRR